MLFHSLSLLLSPFTASTNNFQLIYANCKTAKQNVNLSNIRRSSRKKMIIICIVNKWILACVIHIINKCENKLFACFVCQFPSASHTHTHTDSNTSVSISMSTLHCHVKQLSICTSWNPFFSVSLSVRGKVRPSAKPNQPKIV